jgi:imidazolonepropionase-like amidohydrolase
MTRTLLTGATVIDGTGAPAAPADVVIEDGRISGVGAGLDGDESVDLTGSWLLPGMIDCHVHVMTSSINRLFRLDTPYSLNFYLAAQNLNRTLLGGVTSVRDASGADRGVKEAVSRGLITGPRMKISVAALSQTGGHGDPHFACGLEMYLEHPGKPVGICDGRENVLRKTREMIRAGADVIKICTTGGVLSRYDDPKASQFLPEEVAVVVAEAHAAGITVMAHAQGTNGIKNALRAGVESIEHGIYLDDECIDMMLNQGTFLVPTLIAPVGVLEAPDGVSEDSLRKCRDVMEAHRDSIGRAAAAGVKIAMGTDSGVVPHGRNLEELWHMTGVGMTPMEAIEASTRVAAENLRVAATRGTIEPGKEADLTALSADPLTNPGVFRDSSNVSDVWLAGRRVKGERVREPVGV